MKPTMKLRLYKPIAGVVVGGETEYTIWKDAVLQQWWEGESQFDGSKFGEWRDMPLEWEAKPCTSQVPSDE